MHKSVHRDQTHLMVPHAEPASSAAVRGHQVQLSSHPLAPHALLGSAYASLHGAHLAASVTCSSSNERAGYIGTMLKPMDPCAPTYTERSSMPYRNSYLRKDPPNERENYIGGFLQTLLASVLPANQPVEVMAHGSLLRCADLNSVKNGAAAFNPHMLPDGLLLYLNAVSIALKQSNILPGDPFAAARVMVAAGSEETIVNPCPAELTRASRQLLYVGNRSGPLAVVFDTLADSRLQSSRSAAAANSVGAMLDAAHQHVLDTCAAQERVLLDRPATAAEWPQLEPSRGAVRVLQEMAAPTIDAILTDGSCTRAEQLVALSRAQVRRCSESLRRECTPDFQFAALLPETNREEAVVAG